MKKGFTLVELLVVIVIIGLLIGIAVPSGIAISNKIKKKMLDTKIETVEQGAIVWGQNNKSKIPEGKDNCFIKEIVDDEKVSHCLSKSLTELLNENALEEDELRDTDNDGEKDDKILINPVTNTPLNECNVEIYIKNKRVYSKYDINGTNCGYEKVEKTPNKDETDKTTTKPNYSEDETDKTTTKPNYSEYEGTLVTKDLIIKLDYTYFIDPGIQSGYLSSAYELTTNAITTCNPNKCGCDSNGYSAINCEPIIQNGQVTVNGTATGTYFTGVNEIEYEETFTMNPSVDYSVNQYICVCYNLVNDEKYNNFCEYNDCSSYTLGEFIDEPSTGYKLLIHYWESEADLASNNYSVIYEDTITINQNSTIKQVYVSGYNISYDYSSGNLILKEEAKNNCKNEYYSIYGEKYELYCNYGDFSLNVEDSDGNITSYSIDESIMISYPYNFDGVVLNKISVELE